MYKTFEGLKLPPNPFLCEQLYLQTAHQRGSPAAVFDVFQRVRIGPTLKTHLLVTMCYRPYDRYLCGHRVYRPWVVRCRDGPCPNRVSWPKRMDWYLEILCKECGRRRLHKSTRLAR